MKQRSFLAATCLTLLAAAMPIGNPSQAVTHDIKTLHPLACLPRGPGTTQAELSFGAFGITNPGTTDETVICPLPIDSESNWSDAAEASVELRYRAGAVPGRVTCTVYVNSSYTWPTAASSGVGDLRPAYSDPYSLIIPTATPSPSTWGTAAVSVACILSPKATLMRVTIDEVANVTFTEF